MNKIRLSILSIIILSLIRISHGAERQDSLIVSFLTCNPGAEVYELCGHEAVRIRGIGPEGEKIDSVWNYGTFDFNQPNFIYRFVKGETDYMLSAYPFAWFMPEYRATGRSVYEQDLNLNSDEALLLLTLLRQEAQPENRVYRYNYVKDNCATRILDRLDQSLSRPVIYPDTVAYATFRDEMRSYHKDYPWYQFGIDLALGSGIDYKLSGREDMFVPIEMMHKIEKARIPDGRPLVKASRVLNQGTEDATLGPGNPWLTPIVISWLFFTGVAIACIYMWRKRKIMRWIYSLWFTLCGLTGCLLTFLIYISSHEATSPNLLFLWLNPLQLVIGVGIWFRSWRPAVTAMIICEVLAMIILLTVWPWQPQSANPAFFPLMGATLLMAIDYAIIARKTSYL